MKSLVKWKDYSDDFNSWVENKDIVKISYNVFLPNKPLSNFKLEDAANRLTIPFSEEFLLLDTLPRKPNKKECSIVNFDKSGGHGTHWVAWYENGKTKIYFDSYGVQPSIEVGEYLGSLIRYNTDKLQRAGQVF